MPGVIRGMLIHSALHPLGVIAVVLTVLPAAALTVVLTLLYLRTSIYRWWAV